MNAVMANDQIAMAVWHGQLPRGQAIDFQGDMLCIVWYILKDVVYGIRKTGAWSPVFYHIKVFYSDDDAGSSADIPDLHHCSAFGATPAEALQEVLKAKQVWLEAAQASGKPIPAPWYRPVMDQTV